MKHGNARREFGYTHLQVPFTTKTGTVTTCDEKLFDILVMLKKTGVETQFSCQGDDFGGYICAFTPGVRRIINTAVRLHVNGWLSEQSIKFMDDWCREGERHVNHASNHKIRCRSEELNPQYFSYERDTHSLYGDRTTVRWPKHRTHELKQLLIEIQPHI